MKSNFYASVRSIRELSSATLPVCLDQEADVGVIETGKTVRCPVGPDKRLVPTLGLVTSSHHYVPRTYVIQCGRMGDPGAWRAYVHELTADPCREESYGVNFRGNRPVIVTYGQTAVMDRRNLCMFVGEGAVMAQYDEYLDSHWVLNQRELPYRDKWPYYATAPKDDPADIFTAYSQPHPMNQLAYTGMSWRIKGMGPRVMTLPWMMAALLKADDGHMHMGVVIEPDFRLAIGFCQIRRHKLDASSRYSIFLPGNGEFTGIIEMF